MYKHQLSRVLLKQWSVGGRRRERVVQLDLDTMELSRPLIHEIGGVDDIHLPRPDAIEGVWRHDVERRLDHVVTRLTDLKSLSDPSVVQVLRDCVALHVARSFAILTMLAGRQEAAGSAIAENTIKKFGPDAVFNGLAGLAVVSHDVEAFARERVIVEFDRHLATSGFADELTLNLYRQAQAWLADFSFELWHSESPDFVIGDVPVILYGGSESRTGLLKGVGLATAEAVAMPLSPHIVVALAQEPRWIRAEPPQVLRTNRLQMAQALRSIFLVPDTGLGEQIVREMRAHPPGSTSQPTSR